MISENQDQNRRPLSETEPKPVRDDKGRFLAGHNAPGPGRPAGLPDKAREIKTLIIKAVEELGGGEGALGWLKGFAKDYPQSFFQGLVKILPKEIVADVCQVEFPRLKDDPGTKRAVEESRRRIYELVNSNQPSWLGHNRES